MKDYKEKYEMVLEGIQEILNSREDSIKMSRLKLRLQGIFPELADSEDERIRKSILSMFKIAIPDVFNRYGIDKNDAISYLEKVKDFDKQIEEACKRQLKEAYKIVDKVQYNRGYQDAMEEMEKHCQKEIAWNKEDEENMNNVLYILNQLKETSPYKEDDIAEKTINWLKSLKDRLYSNNEYNKDMLKAIEYCITNIRPLEKEHIAWLEKQSKQKSADEDESKYKLSDLLVRGDWIVRNLENINEDKYDVWCVNYKDINYFICDDLNGNRETFTIDEVNEFFSLWDMSYVKPGDILAIDKSSYQYPFIAIYKEQNKECSNAFDAYCFVTHSGLFCTTNPSSKGFKCSKDLHPATKKECELLFSKMKRARYVWDSENRQLNQNFETMTQEDKDLLARDLFSRLPFGVTCIDDYSEYVNIDIDNVHIEHLIDRVLNGNIMMILRPMSSMNKTERKEYDKLVANSTSPSGSVELINWLNALNFDYNDLISKGIARENEEIDIKDVCF